MKNFGKILTVLLAVAIAVTALVVIGAADDGGVTTVTTEEQFKSAAVNGAKIKLGGDLTLSGTLSVDGTLEVDLGGHTLTLSETNAKSFAVKSGVSLTLTGAGTIKATIVAEVESGGTLTINGTGNGINLVQTDTTAPLFNLKAGSVTTLKGVVSVAPYKLATTRLFVVGEKTTGLTTKAMLKVENATVTVKEPHSGTQTPVDSNSNNDPYAAGMTFAYVNDGADIDITYSTITMEHGHFIKNNGATNGVAVSSGAAGNSIEATKLDNLDLPEGNNITIDITGSKISALNSGYNKLLTKWPDSTSGGSLFDLGNNALAITVNVTDTTLVGTNRTMTVGGSENGDASQIYPTYFNFKNVNFLTSDFTEYATAVLSGNFNVKWDGGIIVLKQASYNAIVSLGNSETYKTDPFGDAAFKAAQIAHSGLDEETFNDTYNDANPYEGLTREKFNSLYYAYTTRANDNDSVTNTYYEINVIDGGNLSRLGFRYSESADGTKWCGIQFTNISCNQWIDNTKNNYAIGTTTKYENFNVINPLNDRELISMRVGYLDEAPVTYIPEYANDAMNNIGENGYTLDYLNNSSGTPMVSGIENGHVWNNTNKPSFSSSIKAPWRYGKYSEASQNGNGYVKFSVDADTIRTSGEPLSTSDGTLIGTPVEGTTYTWVPDGNSSPYTAFCYGSANRYKKDGTAAENKIDGVAYYVHELDIATDTGLYPQTTVTTYARYGKYTYASKTSSPTFDGAQIINTELFIIAENGTLSAGKNLTAESGSFSLATDGSWTRITVVYQVVKNETTMSITATDGTTLENVAAYCYTGSKAYVYVDGILYVTASIFNGVTLPKDVVSKQFGMDQLRFGQNYANRKVGTSICWDNNRVSAYFTENASLKKVSDGAKNITNESDFLIMPTSAKLTLPAATVNWVDANGNSLGTTSVEAGEAIAPTDEIITNAGGSRQEQLNGWYDLGLGWKDDSGNVVDLTSLKAETGKTYTFTATTAPIAPEKLEGIKINLSLYTDFALNVYIPTDKIPSNVTDVKLSGGGIAIGTFVQNVTETDANGKVTTTLKYSTDGKVTMGGVNYIGYTDRIGVADTSLDTYKLSYKVTMEDGTTTTVTYDITYGVPAYAVQVMTDTENQYTDGAKTLVMNMVNYASLVVKYQNADTTSKGYKAYEKLLSTDEYKALVTTIEDSEFQSGGSIYESSIKDLTYTNAADYLKAGFYFSTETPKFYLEYQSGAKNYSWDAKWYTVTITDGVASDPVESTKTYTNGVRTSGGYWAQGVFVYFGLQGSGYGTAPSSAMAGYTDRVVASVYDGRNLNSSREQYRLSAMLNNLAINVFDTNGISGGTSKTELDNYGITSYVTTYTNTNGAIYAIVGIVDGKNDTTPIKILEVNKDENDNVTSFTYEPQQNVTVANVTYNLAAYVGGMIEARNGATEGSDDYKAYAEAAELGKALYVYAQSAKAYADGNNNGN